MKKGYVHIYTGDGKGKTTAAIGLAIRAVGRGMKVFMGQFMKGQHYGEIDTLNLIENISVQQFGDPKCIRRSEVTQAHKDLASKGLDICKKEIFSGLSDIVIMDEVCVAIWFGLLPEDDVINIIKSKPETIELVLTGRKATDKLVKNADLVTDMKEIKHYYITDGVLARKGIEN